jgi:hypothetical protein
VDTEYRAQNDTTFHTNAAAHGAFTDLGGGCGAQPPAPRATTIELPGDAQAMGPIWLCIQEGKREARPRSIPLRPGDELVLGSGREGGAGYARIDDAAVSARHCRVAHTRARRSR